MKVSNGFFEELEPGAVPGFRIRLYVMGSNFLQRAHPLLARVGTVEVERIFISPGGEGFSGLLAREPNNGGRLFVRYADEKEFSTGVVYGSVPIV
jgi:hypothetical protein